MCHPHPNEHAPSHRILWWMAPARYLAFVAKSLVPFFQSMQRSCVVQLITWKYGPCFVWSAGMGRRAPRNSPFPVLSRGQVCDTRKILVFPKQVIWRVDTFVPMQKTSAQSNLCVASLPVWIGPSRFKYLVPEQTKRCHAMLVPPSSHFSPRKLENVWIFFLLFVKT